VSKEKLSNMSARRTKLPSKLRGKERRERQGRRLASPTSELIGLYPIRTFY